jgi:hypothetical protein
LGRPPHRQAVQEFITTRQGYRLATSTGGVLTGRGADIILIDDPLKPEEALSDAQRQACNEWYDHTLYSRQNDERRGATIIIMQRLHEDDLVGHVLAQEEWEIIRFPAKTAWVFQSRKKIARVILCRRGWQSSARRVGSDWKPGHHTEQNPLPLRADLTRSR